MTRGAAFKEAVRAAYVRAHPDERFTDTALAKRSGVSDFTLRRLWAGDVPSLSTLLSVANASGMSIIPALMALQGQSALPAEEGPLDRIATALERLLEERPPEQRPPSARYGQEDLRWIAEQVAEQLARERPPLPTSPRRPRQG